MKSWDIVGYTYQADNWLPSAIVGALTTNPGDVNHGRTPQHPDENVERHLDLLARLKGIDRTDESTFDSDEFPKVIFASQVEDDDETFREADGTYIRYGDL